MSFCHHDLRLIVLRLNVLLSIITSVYQTLEQDTTMHKS